VVVAVPGVGGDLLGLQPGAGGQAGNELP